VPVIGSTADTAASPLRAQLKTLLNAQDPAFWPRLRAASAAADDCADVLALSTLRRRALARLPAPPDVPARPLRVALIGGYSLFPLQELVTHLLAMDGHAPELFTGRFDNDTTEILDAESDLYGFRPDVVVMLPSHRRCAYTGALTDAAADVRRQVDAVSGFLLDQCRRLHDRSGAAIVLSNFALPSACDPGPFRTRTLASDWSFRKAVNLQLGLDAPAAVHICDTEFMACRRGTWASEDPRGWFESKQIGAPALLLDIAREVVRIVRALHTPPKKVLVLDLDNTLWGGVVGDDGVDGIDIGDTSPRGEAFKAFQTYVRSLTARGVLLGVCSKNNPETAREPFERHPEMALRLDDFVAFTANWQPKSDNLRAMAARLQLGLDSFVFVDDNPAEIDIVRQYAPEVTTVLLGPDPSTYVRQLQDSRLFEPTSLTAEDSDRTRLYRTEAARQELQDHATDIDAFLSSLQMQVTIDDVSTIDAPRVAQLINKSNQFNLTTRRRTEADVAALVGDPRMIAFSLRLADRFGDHGLIGVVIGRITDDEHGRGLDIDTWLMSCRVLNRQVEHEALNELMRRATTRGCRVVRGRYLPTAKNGLVRDLLPRLGFADAGESPDGHAYTCDVGTYRPHATHLHRTGTPQ
jgi:FkbH-like protein